MNECIEVVDLKEAMRQLLERRVRRQRRKKEVEERERMLRKSREDTEGSSFITWDQDLQRRKELLDTRNENLRKRMRELTQRSKAVEDIYRMMMRREEGMDEDRMNNE